jgi:hypothetical protein
MRETTSMPWTAFMCREKSRTTPGPMALPAIDVPPPRLTSGVLVARQAATTATTSSTLRGNTTPSGATR